MDFADAPLTSGQTLIDERRTYIVSQHRLSTLWSSYKSRIIRASCCANDAYILWMSSASRNTWCGIVRSESPDLWLRVRSIIPSYKAIREPMWTICIKRRGLLKLAAGGLFPVVSEDSCKDSGSSSCQVSSLVGSRSSSCVDKHVASCS